jgi:predicted dehydrogenase/nucleoside-diphosphate-sugar epimerase
MTIPSIGIVGCGAAAKRYYVPALKRFPGTENKLFLVDQNLEQAEALSKEFGGGKIYSNYRDIIDSVQGVIIALPHFLHFPVSMEFLQAGTHVLCEKPLAESGKQITEMMTIAEKMQVALCVNNTMRTFPSFLKTREIITSGQIGDLKSIEFHVGNEFAWPSSTGFYVDPSISQKGVLFDIGAHILDLVCWWLDGKPSLIRYEDDSYGGPESVSHIEAQANGCYIKILLNRLYDLDNMFKIVGELGTIEGKPFEWNKINIIKNKTIVKKFKNNSKTYPDFVIPILDNFIRVIEGKDKPFISGYDVQQSIELIEECYNKRSKNNLPINKNNYVLKANGKVLVTGATGFIGGSIVEKLYFANDRHVRAGIRKWSSAARLGRCPVDIIQMDLMKMEDIQKALDGVTEIIHCAKGPAGVTVQGTKNLLEVALKKGVNRFVHLSTTEVYGSVNGIIDENSPLVYTGNEYNQTKIDAEKVCWEYLEKGVPITILRPPIVFGPYSKNWSVHCARMLLGRKWGIYENIGEGKCNLVYIDDLVKVILLSLKHPKAIGHAFNINNQEVITWNEYFMRYNEAMGLPPLRIIHTSQANFRTALMEPVRIIGRVVKNNFLTPVKIIADSFNIVKVLMKETENALKATPSPDELKLFNKRATFSINKVTDMLEFAPEVSLNEGLRRTVNWMINQGILLNKKV